MWVWVGVLGRESLGLWATLLSQDSRPKWIWVPQCRTESIVVQIYIYIERERERERERETLLYN